jgi:hypothetical protein
MRVSERTERLAFRAWWKAHDNAGGNTIELAAGVEEGCKPLVMITELQRDGNCRGFRGSTLLQRVTRIGLITTFTVVKVLPAA